MTREEYLAHLRSDGLALAAGADGNFDEPAAGCPGWDVAGLVTHVGQVHRRYAEVVRTGEAPPRQRPAPPAARNELLGWYRKGLDGIVAALEDVDPDKPVWNWSRGPQVARFWPRRMAQETLVHRWDVEAAAGTPSPLDRDLAADGIDELLEVYIASDVGEARAPVGAVTGALHVHLTDVQGEWLVSLDRDWRTVTIERRHAKGAVAIRGPASDVLLVLWRRLPDSTVEIHGDAALLEAWRDLSEL